MDLQQFETLIAAVKPSAAGIAVSSETSLIDDLGMDSLDLLQLTRKVERLSGQQLELEDWIEEESEKDGHRYTIGSFLALVEG